VTDVTVTQIVSVPFGLRLAEAARSARALLRHRLADASATFETWVVLNMLSQRGQPIRRDALEPELAEGLSAEVTTVATAIDQLAAAGLLRLRNVEDGAVEVALTPGGEAEYGRLFDIVDETRARLLGSIDADDLRVTLRVLTQVNERAESLLAG
jgi:MarR family transcriptional regulator for hemolysin